MNNTELKMILKLIDLHTEEYQQDFYNAPKAKRINNIEILKQDIKDLFEITNGVVASPCKVGDMAYVIENGMILVGEIVEIKESKEPETVLRNAPIQKEYYVNTARTPFGYELTPFKDNDFGITIFVGENAKSRAEQKLNKGGADNG